MTTSESKGRFFLQNESIRIDSNRELECSTGESSGLVTNEDVGLSVNVAVTDISQPATVAICRTANSFGR